MNSQLIWLMPLQNVGFMPLLQFTAPVARRHLLATLDPAPTDKDISDAFKELPWADEIGVPARGVVVRRKEWKAQCVIAEMKKNGV